MIWDPELPWHAIMLRLEALGSLCLDSNVWVVADLKIICSMVFVFSNNLLFYEFDQRQFTIVLLIILKNLNKEANNYQSEVFRCQNLADLSVGKKWMMKLKPVQIHKIFAYWIWNVNGKCEVPAQSLAHNVYERATGHHSTFFSDVRIQQNCLQERSKWCNLKSVEINKTFVYWILKVNGGSEVRAQSSPHHVNEKVR